MRGSAGTVCAFGILAVANLGVAVYLNTEVLTDEVYRGLLAGQGSGSQIETLLAVTRRWELLGYVIGPLALAGRIGIMALLVQLGLILLGLRLPFGKVFFAGIVAQFALFMGTLGQLFWLVSLPEAARTAEQLETIPGALSGLFYVGNALGPELALLLRRVTLFDLGWIVLFTLALEEPGKVSGAEAAAAVTGVWILATVSQWGVWLYLTGFS